MTLESLKNYWQDLCLSERDVNTFLIGTNFTPANNTDDKYPLCFWEMPYAITPIPDKQIDTVTCALSVFLSTKQDDIKDWHQAISFAKTIGDVIILRASEDVANKQFRVDSFNSISLTEYSDDSVAGIRYDLTLTVKRDYCKEDLDEYFDDKPE